MKCKIKLVFAFILLGLVGSCGDDKEVETVEIKFKKEGELYLLKDGEINQQVDIEIADTEYETRTGLMHRESMEDDQGMLFIYANEAPRSFYMKNTYIPLDLIFYDKDTTVVSYIENAVPLDETSLPSEKPAQFILELNAGKVQEWKIEIGDKMTFERIQ